MTERSAASPQLTVVHLLRHGEVHNPEGILYGKLPGYGLSDRGHGMARLVADHLAGRDVTVVASSPLERARETAQPLLDAFRVSLRIDERLVEADNSFEGRDMNAGKSYLDPRLWHLLVNPFRPSWGEPYGRIAARMLAVVDAARRTALGHEAVLVSHQLPVWTARNALENRRLWHDPRRRRCNLASLTSLTYQGDELVSLSYCEPARSLYPGSTGGVGA